MIGTARYGNFTVNQRQQPPRVFHPGFDMHHTIHNRNRPHLHRRVLQQKEKGDIVVERQVGINEDGAAIFGVQLGF